MIKSRIAAASAVAGLAAATHMQVSTPGPGSPDTLIFPFRLCSPPNSLLKSKQTNVVPLRWQQKYPSLFVTITKKLKMSNLALPNVSQR